ncbi:hypothetical protein PO909_031978 [Leuciscus waleckii]
MKTKLCFLGPCGIKNLGLMAFKDQGCKKHYRRERPPARSSQTSVMETRLPSQDSSLPRPPTPLLQSPLGALRHSLAAHDQKDSPYEPPPLYSSLLIYTLRRSFTHSSSSLPKSITPSSVESDPRSELVFQLHGSVGFFLGKRIILVHGSNLEPSRYIRRSHSCGQTPSSVIG